MFNIGPEELILILVVALIVFGPKRLPEIGRTVGKAMREFRKATQDIREEFTVGRQPRRTHAVGDREGREPGRGQLDQPGRVGTDRVGSCG